VARRAEAKRAKADARAEACLTVEKDGVWVYGNRAALQQMAERLAVIAESDPSEHYELHLRWHLGSHRAKRPNVYALVHPEVSQSHSARDFELTLMVVEPKDLRALRRHQRSGLLPQAWRDSANGNGKRGRTRGRRTRG
jgi:hypothetical protein